MGERGARRSSMRERAQFLDAQARPIGFRALGGPEWELGQGPPACHLSGTMRVAVVTSSYPDNDQDPAGHFVRAEVRSLIEEGHEVTVFAPRGGRGSPLTRILSNVEPTIRELPHWGLFGWPGALARIRARPWRLLGLVPFVTSARRTLHECGHFDRIEAHWLVPGFWPICRDFVVCTHVIAHGSDVRLLERLPRALQRSVLTAATRNNVTVRCVSCDLADRLRRIARGAGISAPTIEIRPASIDLPHLPSRGELRERLGYGDTPSVVIVGRAVKSKRVETAIGAIRAARAQLAATASRTDAFVDPIRIYVIGDGPELERWKKANPDVHWLGRLGRYEALCHIRAADLVVSASELEGAPTALREARALGTEVVSAAAGDLELAALGDAGLHVVRAFTDEPNGPAARLIATLLSRVVIAK